MRCLCNAEGKSSLAAIVNGQQEEKGRDQCKADPLAAVELCAFHCALPGCRRGGSGQVIAGINTERRGEETVYVCALADIRGHLPLRGY
ncbi:hypothetical protein I7I50_05763 [Histoplasma capsulatum G186AR]|uniref:Uncharacterized protein n=1 Tax=Ajellomyces capsulatus TaxID=5037 RepID=A0A8H7ZD58_AJECA|nr:hypothetical protein I7I52_04023 [Histoplasma capsulatum]QSS76345.1 hypothetical protein I7I50_05763 [Histoplasma capsulatum G186AR]